MLAQPRPVGRVLCIQQQCQGVGKHEAEKLTSPPDVYNLFPKTKMPFSS
jgi:hypothetical protein